MSWNSLPNILRESACDDNISDDCFKHSLKTFLFGGYWRTECIRGVHDSALYKSTFTYLLCVLFLDRVKCFREKFWICSRSLSLTVSTTWTRFGSRSRRCSGCSLSLTGSTRWYDATATTSTWNGSGRSRRGTRTTRCGICRNSPSRRHSFHLLVCFINRDTAV